MGYNIVRNRKGAISMENYFDLHVYTNNTKGGNDKVSFLCETAVAKGINAIAFTDICAVDLFEKYDMKRRLRHSYFDMTRARSVFFGSVLVLCGIEFAQAAADKELVDAILSKQEYDIVLTSVTRYTDGKEFGITFETPQEDFNAFASDYAGLLLRTVNETDFDVLSKPLAPIRNTTADLGFFEERMLPVMKALAEKEKALEIDAKDLLGSERIRDLYIRLLKAFREYGGRYVTIGSESKFNEEIGNGSDIAQTAAKMAGFSVVTLYDKRIPYTFDI